MATEALPLTYTPPPRKGLIVFVVGGFGGMSPTLLRIAVDLLRQDQSLQYVGLSFILGSLILALMGGALAAIWGEVDLKKVFYLGLGLPSLITGGIATSTSSSTSSRVQAELLTRPAAIVGTPVAVARIREAADEKRLKITLPTEIGYTGAVAILEYGNNTASSVLLRQGQAIEVPGGVVAVSVATPAGDSDRIPVATILRGGFTEIVLAAVKDPFFGFKYAVGAHSKPFRLSVERVNTGGSMQSRS